MRKLLSTLTLVSTTISLSIIAVCLYPFDRKGEKVNKIGRFWAITNIKASGIKVYIEGLENISKPPYILMCNHQSSLDIFALLSSLRVSFKWIAKKELFVVPFLGWALKSGRNISLDRENPRKALKAMPKGKGQVHIKIGKPVCFNQLYTGREKNFLKNKLMVEVRSHIEKLIDSKC